MAECHQGGQHLFTPISHPELRQLGQNNIHTFLREREIYLLRITDARNSGGTVEPIPLKSSVDADLLTSLIELEEFGSEIDSIDKVTDLTLQGWLEEQQGNSLDSVTVEQLSHAVRTNVRINLHESDAKLRIIKLFSDYKTFLRVRKWSAILEENPKVAVEQLCDLLKPDALRTKVTNDLQLSKRELRKDWKKFYKYVVKQAVFCEAFVPAKANNYMKSKPIGRNTSRVDNGESSAFKPSVSRTSWNPTTWNGHTANSSISTNSSPSKKNETLSTKKAPSCLNPACEGFHLVKDCPKTDETKKRELLKNFHETRRARSSIMALNEASHLNKVPNTVSTSEPLANSGKYKAMLADHIDVVINGDYGADHSALSQEHLNRCAGKGIFVQVLPLKNPIPMRLAMGSSSDDDSRTVVAKSKARISTTLHLPSGPLRLRNLEYLVFDEPMDEVILSRPILQTTGFDLDKHLETVREKYHDTDFSHIGFSPAVFDVSKDIPPSIPGRLSQLMLSCPENVSESSECSVPATCFYGDTASDIHENQEKDDVPTGLHDELEVRSDLNLLLAAASECGLPKQLFDRLRNLVLDYQDIFRNKMGSDPPANIPPMTIQLRADAKPVHVKLRRYSPPQAAFLRKKVEELLSFGLVYRNSNSRWASAPLIVPKSGPEQFRLTVDLRPVNAQTDVIVWPMPNMDTVLSNVRKSTCFASLDFCHGFWQLPLASQSQECQSFICPDGVFTPTRVLHGQVNAVAYFQSSIQNVFMPLRDALLQWLDDILAHACSASELMDTLETFFSLCRLHGLKLHSRKCRFFLREVNWCGRLISQNGVRLDPRRLKALLAISQPTTELQQFVCAANWMRTAIPRFNELIEPLSVILEEVYSMAGRRTRKSVQRISLNHTSWNTEHLRSFTAVKEALHQAATLAHPDESKLLCLFTDASDKHWAAVLTQIPEEHKDLPFVDQHHEPLSFLSGSFRKSAASWSTPEKEGFAIVESVTRLDYLLLRPSGFWLFTDHKNLTFIFNPFATHPTMAKHVANKIERWSMKLAAFRYQIVHITGEENVWADLLSRWGATGFVRHTPCKLSALMRAPVAPHLEADLKWPTLRELVKLQRKALADIADTDPPSGSTDMPPPHQNGHSLHVTSSGAVWVPATATHMQLRLCVIGHCGRGGHRGVNTTFRNVSESFFWTTMKSDISVFCNTCLHCISTLGGTRIPRPLSHAMHADRPNELLHFDFLYLGPSESDQLYCLVVKDDASSFVWLEPCAAADSQHVVEVLLRWFASFGVALTWISDQGAHFKNTTVNLLNRELRAFHHFTTPYHPQANGTVESMCKEVLRAARALLSEFRLKPSEWPSVIRLIQSILNHSVRPSLNNRAPITAFAGLPADNPLRTLLPPPPASPASLDFVKAQRIVHIESLIKSLDELHRNVAEKRTRKRQQEVDRHNDRTRIRPVNFDIGDFVLVADTEKHSGNKLRLKWKGPRRITRCESALVYEVEDLLNQSNNLIHVSRLKFYADSQLHMTETLLDTIDHNEVHYNVVTKILGLRFNSLNNRFEVQCKWKGFGLEEPTWEPFANMREDIPDMLDKFLQTFTNQELVAAARAS